MVRQHDTDVELRIEGPGEAGNHGIFEALSRNRAGIEDEFGEPLEWNLVEGRKKCSIKKCLTGGGYRADRATWPEIQDTMIDAMVRLEEAVKPWVAAFPS